ncbi:Gfo/Idh/MocA family protein [Kineococcus rubinsiae]|uniref:Gfo/Idh/MocA family protein n=1 Tax=Kineococcus rubinsiae TaxID=2609562 RepID=UPI00142F7BF2|nr:Gfo/Idh/MocA family oxidoreductase [Kineococcus rubinsiae]NIZ89721.1 Gfo/Idh/MocA family oxidoreductase [Kineococcus rubinsiae]
MTIRLIHAGLGGWGGDWEANAIGPVAEVDRVAVVEPHEPTLRRFQELRGLPDAACSTSFEETLASVDADAVLLTTPVRTHVPMALQALEAGKHVLVEKPFASTVEEAAVAVRRAEELGLVLQVSQNYRFYPAPRAAQQLLAAGELGDLSGISVDFRRWDHDAAAGTYGHYDFPHPLIHDMAIHHFDLLRKITGQEAVRVFARASDPDWSRYAEEAAAVMSIELADGLVVSYRGSWVSRLPQTNWGGTWTVDGSEGALTFTTRAGGPAGPDGDAVTVFRPGADPAPVPLPEMPLWGRSAGLQEFARAVEGGPASEANARGNLGSVALMEAATRSAASGRVEDVVVPADLRVPPTPRTEVPR